jgi:hypothetical protein
MYLEKTAFGGFFWLFNFRFLVDHVFTDPGVEFFDLELLGVQTFVFRRRVEVSGAG